MDDIKQRIEEIESAEEVILSFNPATERIVADGKASAVDRAIEQLKAFSREDVVAVLRARLPEPEEEIVKRELPVNPRPKAIQRSNRQIWLAGKSGYYQPSVAEDDLMWSKVEEGDLVVSDFALSFTIIKSNGLIVAVDRKGRITPPSPYSPAVAQAKLKA